MNRIIITLAFLLTGLLGGTFLYGVLVRKDVAAHTPLPDLDTLFALAEGKVKGAVIWDTALPASMNVANTIAGIEDGIVLSPEFAEKYLKKWNLNVIRDLRGMFTGSETGSKKNDVYRWAVREYLSK